MNRIYRGDRAQAYDSWYDTWTSSACLATEIDALAEERCIDVNLTRTLGLSSEPIVEDVDVTLTVDAEASREKLEET